MRAEDKLKKLYLEQEPRVLPKQSLHSDFIHVTYSGGVYISAEHIDLIADLVVERLTKEK